MASPSSLFEEELKRRREKEQLARASRIVGPVMSLQGRKESRKFEEKCWRVANQPTGEALDMPLIAPGVERLQRSFESTTGMKERHLAGGRYSTSIDKSQRSCTGEEKSESLSVNRPSKEETRRIAMEVLEEIFEDQLKSELGGEEHYPGLESIRDQLTGWQRRLADAFLQERRLRESEMDSGIGVHGRQEDLKVDSDAELLMKREASTCHAEKNLDARLRLHEEELVKTAVGGGTTTSAQLSQDSAQGDTDFETAADRLTSSREDTHSSVGVGKRKSDCSDSTSESSRKTPRSSSSEDGRQSVDDGLLLGKPTDTTSASISEEGDLPVSYDDLRSFTEEGRSSASTVKGESLSNTASSPQSSTSIREGESLRNTACSSQSPSSGKTKPPSSERQEEHMKRIANLQHIGEKLPLPTSEDGEEHIKGNVDSATESSTTKASSPSCVEGEGRPKRTEDDSTSQESSTTKASSPSSVEGEGKSNRTEDVSTSQESSTTKASSPSSVEGEGKSNRAEDVSTSQESSTTKASSPSSVEGEEKSKRTEDDSTSQEISTTKGSSPSSVEGEEKSKRTVDDSTSPESKTTKASSPSSVEGEGKSKRTEDDSTSPDLESSTTKASSPLSVEGEGKPKMAEDDSTSPPHKETKHAKFAGKSETLSVQAGEGSEVKDPDYPEPDQASVTPHSEVRFEDIFSSVVLLRVPWCFSKLVVVVPHWTRGGQLHQAVFDTFGLLPKEWSPRTTSLYKIDVMDPDSLPWRLKKDMEVSADFDKIIFVWNEQFLCLKHHFEPCIPFYPTPWKLNPSRFDFKYSPAVIEVPWSDAAVHVFSWTARKSEQMTVLELKRKVYDSFQSSQLPRNFWPDRTILEYRGERLFREDVTVLSAIEDVCYQQAEYLRTPVYTPHRCDEYFRLVSTDEAFQRYNHMRETVKFFVKVPWQSHGYTVVRCKVSDTLADLKQEIYSSFHFLPVRFRSEFTLLCRDGGALLDMNMKLYELGLRGFEEVDNSLELVALELENYRWYRAN